MIYERGVTAWENVMKHLKGSNITRFSSCQPVRSSGRRAAISPEMAAPALTAVSGGVMAAGASPTIEERLAEVERQRAELHQALSDAAWIHRKLCAPRHVRRGRFEIASEIFPVGPLPGDFLCIHDTAAADGRMVTTLAIADIAGKGVVAGMWITLLAGLFRLHAESGTGLGDMVAGINRDLCLLHSDTPLTTMFAVRLDAKTGALSYCNAGHPPALLFRAGGPVELLEHGGALLGVFPDARFRSVDVDFGRDDTLLAFSDGLTECRDRAGREFGQERLLDHARRCLGSDAAGMVFSLLAAVRDFSSEAREDDVSVMVLRGNGGAGTRSVDRRLIPGRSS